MKGKKVIYKYKDKEFTKEELYMKLGISRSKAYVLMNIHKCSLQDLPNFISFNEFLEERIEIKPDPCNIELRENEIFVEEYRGFHILRKYTVNFYLIAEHKALSLVSVVAARRCIDTYLNHLENAIK